MTSLSFQVFLQFYFSIQHALDLEASHIHALVWWFDLSRASTEVSELF